MKKLLSLILAMIMLLGLMQGCAEDEDEYVSSSKKKPTETSTGPTTETPDASEPATGDKVFGTIPTLPFDVPTDPSGAIVTTIPTVELTEPAIDVPTAPPEVILTEPPTQKATQKPTNPPTQKPTNPPTQKPTNPPTQAPTKPKFTTYNISALPQNVKDVAAATIQTISGTMTEEGQVDQYTFTPAIDGWYTFQLSEVRADIYFEMCLLDRLGAVVDYGYYVGNGAYICAELNAGETYTFEIYQYDGLGDYILNIGEQPPTIDISAYSAVNDSVAFADQRNVYTFVPEYDGNYTIELAEVRNGIYLNVTIFDRLGAEVDSIWYAGNGTYMIPQLNAGETYTIVVEQEESLGSYTLKIGKQKATTNIAPNSIVKDSFDHIYQNNIYTFTATKEEHYLKISDIKSSVSYNLDVYNHLEEYVDWGYDYEYDAGRVYYLEPGQVYTIVMSQYYEEFGTYTLTLE